jgi:predicted  nucleic acid-binding Zn-ribbon protein
VRKLPRKPIPNWIKREVVKLWLQGFKREEIAEKLKISSGSVWNVINEFKEKAKELTLEEAARIYDVEGDVEALRQLADYVRSWMDIKDATEVFSIYKELQDAGVKPNELKDFLEVYKATSSGKFSVSDFISSAIDLHKMAKEMGFSLKEITVEYQKKLNEFKSLEARVKSLNKEIAGLEKVRAQAIKLKKSLSEAEQELNVCNELIGRLEARRKSLEKEVAEAEERVRQLRAEIPQISRKVEDLRAERGKLEGDVESRRRELTTLMKEIEDKKSEYARLQSKCVDLGFLLREQRELANSIARYEFEYILIQLMKKGLIRIEQMELPTKCRSCSKEFNHKLSKDFVCRFAESFKSIGGLLEVRIPVSGSETIIRPIVVSVRTYPIRTSPANYYHITHPIREGKHARRYEDQARKG